MRGHHRRSYQPSHRAKLTRWALAVVLGGVAGALIEWFLRWSDNIFSTQRGKQ